MLRRCGEAVLLTVAPGKTQDTFVIGDQRTGKLDRGGDQEPIGWVAVF
jgi:hypothetical protein